MIIISLICLGVGSRQIGPLADLAANWAPHFLGNSDHRDHIDNLDHLDHLDLEDSPAVLFHISHWYLSWNTAGGGNCK